MHKSLTEKKIHTAAANQLFGLKDHGFCIECGKRYHDVEQGTDDRPCRKCWADDSIYSAVDNAMVTV